ncbi:MAG: hypothetical protein ISR47_06505 [Rhodospirillales bacterium]|nr:hypothetical protein [Rhodospirillales bacterium]
MSGSVTIEKEMGITHAEFFRVMARALEGRKHDVKSDRVVINDGPQHLEIAISEERKRRIALFCLPVTQVTLTFSGYKTNKIDETLVWFDRHFQRGGG